MTQQTTPQDLAAQIEALAQAARTLLWFQNHEHAEVSDAKEAWEALSEALEVAPAIVAAIRQGEGERYRHKKRGTVYEMIGTAELQAGQPQLEHAQLAIYRGDDGKFWARNTAEFHDGRFEQVAPATCAENAQVPAPDERDDEARKAEIALSIAAIKMQNATQDEHLPSSVARDQGLVWLEGWFDLRAALSPAKGGE